LVSQEYGIAAALPVFRKQGFGHFVNTASTAAHKTVPNQSVYSGTKYAVRAISDGLRQEVAEEKLRVTIISPGFTRTNFADGVTNQEVKAFKWANNSKSVIMTAGIPRLAMVVCCVRSSERHSGGWLREFQGNTRTRQSGP
jgi:NADP-dependent 3-hydroxy acid dehydrogenase YdfG